MGWFENDGADDWWLDGIQIDYETATKPGRVRLIDEEGDPASHLLQRRKGRHGR